jgi:hypothetical protein
MRSYPHASGQSVERALEPFCVPGIDDGNERWDWQIERGDHLVDVRGVMKRSRISGVTGRAHAIAARMSGGRSSSPSST